MKTHHLTATLPLLLLAATLHAQTPSIPGVPEPGMTIWGAVTSSVTSLPVTITSASWTLGDGTTSFTLSSTPPAGGVSKPHIRIITQGTQTFYVMQVPFDTRSFGTARNVVNLADPNLQSDTALRYASFPLKASSPPTYTMTPTINGAVANVKSVDGVNAAGSPPALTTPGLSNPAFTFSERARIVRVDLTIAQTADPYDTWASGFFTPYPSAAGAQTADPDADGQTNYMEYLAGTHPLQGTSAMRVLTMARAANGSTVTLNWASVAGKKYQIETSLNMQTGPTPWTAVGSQTTAAGATTALSITASSAEPRRLYRVKVVP